MEWRGHSYVLVPLIWALFFCTSSVALAPADRGPLATRILSVLRRTGSRATRETAEADESTHGEPHTPCLLNTVGTAQEVFHDRPAADISGLTPATSKQACLCVSAAANCVQTTRGFASASKQAFMHLKDLICVCR